MKTTSISVRRNYHLSNDDSYAKGEWSLSGELDDTDDVQKCFERLANELDAAFQKRYPHVRTYLNFEEVRQASNVAVDYGEPIVLTNDSALLDYASRISIHAASKQVESEKINKGTIEEQIEASKDLDELDGWKLIAKTNPKLQEVFIQREKELINEAVK